MRVTLNWILFFCSYLLSTNCIAHGVDQNTANFLMNNQAPAFIPFLYIGAKHMVTGYDHLLFLIGVIFFLFRVKQIFIYVSLFTIGHSITLLLGVLNHLSVNAYLIDAIIAFSVIYKGFDNLGGWQRLLGRQPNTKLAVFVFGLFHGLGLATKLLEFSLPQTHLFTHLLAFNLGVELGQCIALLIILTMLGFWRRHRSYFSFATLTNTLLMMGGVVLLGYQLTGYMVVV